MGLTEKNQHSGLPRVFTLTPKYTIVMTGITTAAASVPLLISTGAGTETRFVIGVVVMFGVIAGTLFTLFVVPAAYDNDVD